MHVVAAAIHFLLAFMVVACLAIEFALIKMPRERISFRTLARVDALYGLSAGLLAVVGLYRAISLEKGWAYYSHSLPFLIKLSLFAFIAIASIYPTMHFFRARHGDRLLDHAVINRISTIIGLELVLVVALIICASLAAKGIGVVT